MKTGISQSVRGVKWKDERSCFERALFKPVSLSRTRDDHDHLVFHKYPKNTPCFSIAMKYTKMKKKILPKENCHEVEEKGI